jgi:cell shape-determining protein MreD
VRSRDSSPVLHKIFFPPAVSLLHGSFFIDRLFLPFVLGAAGTLAKAISIASLSLFFGDKVHSYSFLDRILWIEAAYNGLLAPAAFFMLSLVKKLFSMTQGRE